MMYPPEPLTRQELERLWHFERRAFRFHVIAMPALVAAAFALFLYGDNVWLRRGLLVLLAVLLLGAALLHRSERCPRCRARLRVRSSLRLRERCHYCGVAFERPPSG